MSIASPCVRICSIDPRTGYCIGCGRSRGEITGWDRMSEPERASLVALLGARPRPAQGAPAVQMDCATCGACSGRAA